MSQINFRSDNVAPVSEAVVRAILAVNEGPASSYGADAVTQRLQDNFSRLFETKVRVFPVSTGTAANALSLSALAPPYGAIYCSDVGHINDSECGAAEFFTGGAKIVPLPATNGRLAAATLESAIAKAGIGNTGKVQPAAISLTEATERGTLYKVDEVKALAAIAKRYRLKVHMDGARFANAVAALGVTPAELTWKAGVDVLSFGATKNGAMSAEGIVVFDLSLADDLAYRCRRAGQVHSKMRFISAQLDAFVADGLWLGLARQANAMAARLSAGLVALPGVELLYPTEINEVFVRLPQKMIKGLDDQGFGILDRGEGMVRLVTAFNVTAADVDTFLVAARGLA
ncbi:MAG: low specificity L-threonine aldolase [Alphaproteobacteria bacterium]|nr:low specificity L-threonine aldolase [Alphaproteobacteria bacterium]